ncbi:TIGR03016 family PEP-CTERM system-associated outer membrane protein [Sneathiella chinensis]|uniref:TIGR03016 family PEP-CTERM system-associated outer membrane protein n=1 Tax=Sneathiella chinensis TaxID=349750 RepID=UPI00146C5C0D|nr:TIGR03016 family PEP-CTERM system-associated outer membrane protein [Sneathiella chinensis]
MLKYSALVTGVLALTAPLSAAADEWTFTPYVGISEQFTDNAFGTPSNEKSDFVTSLDAGITIEGESRRASLNASYNISQDYYAKYHELDGYTQEMLGIGNVELFEDHVFVDGRLSFTEETLARSGNQAATDRTIGSDRTQVFNGQISPYYVQNFGNWAAGIARYSYSETRFSEPNVGGTSIEPEDRKTHEFRVTVESGTRFADYNWTWDAGTVKSEADNGDEFNQNSTTGTIQYPLNSRFALLGTLGYDDFAVDNVDDDEISGVFGGAGLRWTPSPRTDVSVQLGYRYGDPVVDMDAEYALTSLDTLTASYKVTVATADQSLTNTELFDPQGQLYKPNFVITDYVDDVTKSSTLALEWVGTRERNTYSVTSSLIKREFLSDGSDDQVVSVDGKYNRQLTFRANAGMTAGYSQVLEGRNALAKDTTYQLGLYYNYDFGRGFIASASYNFFDRDSADGSDLRENAITLSLTKSF